MSDADKIIHKLDEADELLSDPEEAMLRHAWKRERRPGVEFVDAGVHPDGTLELVDTNGAALDRVSEAIKKPGTRVKRHQLERPTLRNFTAAYERALARGDEKAIAFLTAAGKAAGKLPRPQLKGAKR